MKCHLEANVVSHYIALGASRLCQDIWIEMNPVRFKFMQNLMLAYLYVFQALARIMMRKKMNIVYVCLDGAVCPWGPQVSVKLIALLWEL